MGSNDEKRRIRRPRRRIAKDPTATDLALDARVRQVVVAAKRAGTLGAGSPWVRTDPLDDEAWARAARTT